MNRRTRLFVFGFAAFLVTGTITIQSAKAQGNRPEPAPPKKAEEQFKNIQTLKGIPADELIPTMQFISASLGVECEFCHVQGAFDKDDKKPKQTARKMIDMMFAINKESFDGHREVTCNSCHRGSVDPVSMPPVMSADAKEGPGEAVEEGKKPYSGPSADELIAKYIQASGGAAAIEKITSRVERGTMSTGGHDFPIDVYTKEPGMRASFAHLSGGDSITAFDGHAGWTGMAGHPVREMHGPDLDGAAIDADLHFAKDLKQLFQETKAEGPEKIADRDTYVVIGKREGKTPLKLYFDAQSGLLVRLDRYAETALGRLPAELDYADYREVDGVKVPFRWSVARPGGRFIIQATEVRQNVPIDDAKFAKPPAPAEAQKAAK